MRPTPNSGLELIRAFEGFRSKVYLCAAGYPTIGWGHVVRAGEDFSAGVDEEMATTLLRQDLFRTKRAIVNLTKMPLTENQYAALISFVFSLGSGAYQRSTLRMRLNRGDYAAAAAQFPLWCKAGGRVLPGLLRRRIAERELFLLPSRVGLTEMPNDEKS